MEENNLNGNVTSEPTVDVVVPEVPEVPVENVETPVVTVETPEPVAAPVEAIPSEPVATEPTVEIPEVPPVVDPLAETPTEVPVTSPVEAPVESPVTEPTVEAPVETPVVETPVEPVASPLMDTPTPEPAEVDNNAIMNQVVADVTPEAPVAPGVPTEPTPAVDGTAPVEPTPAPAKKPINKSVIILVVLIVVLIGVCLWRFVFSGNGSEETPPTPVDTPATEQPEPVATNDLTKWGEYEFSLPDGYVIKTLEGKEYAVNAFDKVMAVYEVLNNYPYNLFVQAQEELKADLAQYATVNSVEEKEYNGLNWLVFDTTIKLDDGDVPALATFVSLDSKNTLQFFVYNYGSKSNEEVLSEFSTIMNNVNYTGTSNFVEGEEKTAVDPIHVDTTGISESAFE